jgi:hypothetical protein
VRVRCATELRKADGACAIRERVRKGDGDQTWVRPREGARDSRAAIALEEVLLRGGHASDADEGGKVFDRGCVREWQRREDLAEVARALTARENASERKRADGRDVIAERVPGVPQVANAAIVGALWEQQREERPIGGVRRARDGRIVAERRHRSPERGEQSFDRRRVRRIELELEAGRAPQQREAVARGRPLPEARAALPNRRTVHEHSDVARRREDGDEAEPAVFGDGTRDFQDSDELTRVKLDAARV